MSGSKPTPVVDVDSAFYWDGLREHRLVLQQCRACERFRFPPMVSCPYCGSRDLDERAVTGRGTVYSWVGVHRALDPAFADDVPYTVAAVDLDEGARVIVRIDTPTDADATTFGARVRASYVDHADWTELRFVVEEPAS